MGGLVELQGREGREEWGSVRSDISTARDITQRVVIVASLVITMEAEIGLTNFLPEMTLMSLVAKEEEVSKF